MAINPELIFRGLAKGLGVNPDQAQGAVNYLIVQLQNFEREKEALRAGTQAMVAHFNARLDRQEALLLAILEHLQLSTAEDPAHARLENPSLPAE